MYAYVYFEPLMYGEESGGGKQKGYVLIPLHHEGQPPLRQPKKIPTGGGGIDRDKKPRYFSLIGQALAWLLRVIEAWMIPGTKPS